ncbi:putative actin-like protein [Leptomonas pyrrhocoris]|uniref:Putative actin-like protein n=1 Tax=Leptomonas pyrrhocoris TaxID=157538 RepID=A0A0M9G2A4_LEPPY|nr:putative actin-like protein [Leptomonas pyrrhocoris]KPA80706.1 putative actin-like protein [Leptomonas pyrrhocoris]|eukprot:XP_015659145.1 putative actin-like protein [Leptomonas pyrrhocoris]
METTYIVDCGHHTIKYAGLSKRSKRTVEVLVKERRSECNAYVADDERLRQSVPQLLSGELRTDEELTLMLLLDTFASQKSKASLLYSCFEQFGCKKVCLHYTACTGLYAAGETSGVVVDIGYAGVQLSSVYKGVVQTALSSRLTSLGTRSLDCELHRLLRSDVTEEALHRIKAQCCSLTEREEPQPDLTLPDGTVFPSKGLKRSELHRASNALLFSTTSSVPDSMRLIFQKHSIRYPDSTSWLRLGGGSQIDGVEEVLGSAMAHPLCRHTPKELHLKDATHGPVSGGIILSQLNVFKGMCVGAGDYEEYGPDGCVRMQVVDAR